MNYSLYKKHNLPHNRIIPVHVYYANVMTLLEGFCEMKGREKLMSGVLKLTGHLPAAAIAPLEIKSATKGMEKGCLPVSCRYHWLTSFELWGYIIFLAPGRRVVFVGGRVSTIVTSFTASRIFILWLD